MKTAIIFDVKDHKLQPNSYSQVYRSQFIALWDKFRPQAIMGNCNAKDINADVIIFWDIHSSHHIEIEGIEKHPAIKYTYLNDPHQTEIMGRFNVTDQFIYKLGAKNRITRALKRGIDYIICPSVNAYYQYLAPHIGKRAEEMLVWFPMAPTIRYFKDRKRLLSERAPAVLGNGSLAEFGDTQGYKFRTWAFHQPCISFVHHAAFKPDSPHAPSGKDYPDFLARLAGALALNSLYIVPKYSEIPLAGCVCFAQEHPDYTRMGFKDGENCIYVNRENFTDTINAFKGDVGSYQHIADAGRKLMEDNWTAEKFADFIYDHAAKARKGSS